MEKLSEKLSNFHISKELVVESYEVSKEFMKLSLPQILFYCCLFLQGSLNLFFISYEYKDQDMLNAVGISNLYVTITTAITLLGIIGALDTLASNAYGARNYRLLGIYNDRCRYIAFTFWALMCVFHFFFARSCLRLLRVEDRVIDLVVEYASIYVLSYLFSINFQINTKFFVLIEKAQYNLYIAITSLILHTVGCWFFVCVVKCGIRGASIAITITQIYNLVTSTYLIHQQGLPKESLVYFTKEGLREWWGFLKVATPGIVIQGGEWLGYEIQGMVALFISPLAYSTVILTFNLEALMFPYTAGINATISMKVGEKLIAEDSRLLKKYIAICYGFSLFLSSIVLSCVGLFGKSYFLIMSPNKEIYNNCIGLIGYICWFIINNNGFYFFMGVLKAIGYLRNPTILSFVLFYLVNLPLTYIFCFVYDMEVKGIWRSFATGYPIGLSIFIYWTFSFDMEELKKKALERIENDRKVYDKKEMEVINSKDIDAVKERLLLER